MWPFRFAMHRKRGLRMMVVSLLSTSPKNGVELMDGVEALTRGWWRPSPGSMYPLLERMAAEGTVNKREDGRYELTPKANVELEVSFGPRFRSPRTSSDIVDEIGSLTAYMEDLSSADREEFEKLRMKVKSLGKRLQDLAEGGSSGSGPQNQQ